MDDGEIETLDEEYLEESPEDKRLPIPKQWTHFNTIRMLDAYIHFIPKKDTYLTKKQFFEDVALYLEKDNIFFTGYQVENKFRGLLRTHRLSKQKGKYFSKINDVVLLDSSIKEEHYFKPTSSEFEQVNFSQNEDDGDEEEEFEKMDTKQQEAKLVAKNSKIRKAWLIDEVYKLVNEYERLLPQKSNCPLKKDWWNAVASNLRDMGIMVNATNCEFKWNNLVKFYKSKGKNYQPRLNLHKQIERIRVSQGLDRASSDDEKVFDDVLDDEEDEYFIPKKTQDNIVVKTEPTTYAIEKVDIHSIQTPVEAKSKQSFEDVLLNYLQKKEVAKQKRHEEIMELKKKQLLLLEKLCSSQK